MEKEPKAPGPQAEEEEKDAAKSKAGDDGSPGEG